MKASKLLGFYFTDGQLWFQWDIFPFENKIISYFHMNSWNPPSACQVLKAITNWPLGVLATNQKPTSQNCEFVKLLESRIHIYFSCNMQLLMNWWVLRINGMELFMLIHSLFSLFEFLLFLVTMILSVSEFLVTEVPGGRASRNVQCLWSVIMKISKKLK